MEIIALQDYTDQYVSLYENEVRDIFDSLANKLITKGIVAQHDNVEQNSGSNSSSNSGGGGTMYIYTTIEYGEDDQEIVKTGKSYNDIIAAIDNGILPVLVMEEEPIALLIISAYGTAKNDDVTNYVVAFNGAGHTLITEADSDTDELIARITL